VLEVWEFEAERIAHKLSTLTICQDGFLQSFG
jgi:hypothetical protein